MIDYKRPTDEQWGELYPIADEISALSPWTQIPDSNIFVVETPADNEPFFCIILGHAGREGVAMYPGYNAFAWMEQLRLDAPTDIRPMVLMEQRILVLNFGDEEDIQPEDREFINKIGIQCSGKNQWPFFCSVHPGMFPFPISTEEAVTIQTILPRVLSLCRAYFSGSWSFKSDGTELFHSYFSDKKGEWIDEVIPATNIKISQNIPVLEPKNIELWETIQKKPMTDSLWELDFGYIPVSGENSEFGISHGFPLIVLMNRDTVKYVDFIQLGCGEEIGTKPLFMFLECIQKHGKPATLFVRNYLKAGMVHDLCKKLDFTLRIYEEMTSTKVLFEKILEKMWY